MSFLFGGAPKPAPAPVMPSPRSAGPAAAAGSTAALLAARMGGFASTVKTSGLGDTMSPLVSTSKLLGGGR